MQEWIEIPKCPEWEVNVNGEIRSWRTGVAPKPIKTFIQKHTGRVQATYGLGYGKVINIYLDEIIYDLFGVEYKRNSKEHQISKIGCIYVMEFSTHKIKVGNSKNVEARVAKHTYDALVHDVIVTASWQSVQLNDCTQIEKTLISWCLDSCTKSFGKEYFEGLDFNLVVENAKSLIKCKK